MTQALELAREAALQEDAFDAAKDAAFDVLRAARQERHGCMRQGMPSALRKVVKLEHEKQVRSRSGLGAMTVEQVVTTLACGAPCDREELLERTRTGAVKKEHAEDMNVGTSRDVELPGGIVAKKR